MSSRRSSYTWPRNPVRQNPQGGRCAGRPPSVDCLIVQGDSTTTRGSDASNAAKVAAGWYMSKRAPADSWLGGFIP